MMQFMMTQVVMYPRMGGGEGGALILIIENVREKSESEGGEWKG